VRHLDLFSGIGGFALAASWVWPDHEIVAFCEKDEFCQKVLGKHWPDVPVIADIRDMKGKDFDTVDLISGGFPCQPFSTAGKRAGATDDRFLWPEMLRVIREVHPRWIIAENVPGLISIDKGLVLERVLTDLEGEGYQVQPIVVPAAAVGAPHRRDRIWIIANRTNSGPESLREREDSDFQDAYAADTERDRFASRRTGIIKKENCKQADGGEANQPSGKSGDAADTRNQRLQGSQRPGTHEERPATHGSATQCREVWDEPWIEAATRLCGIHDGISRGMDRANRLKALGNGQVPLQAAMAWRILSRGIA
jgi:DNA (cytosine-5)-methyltransferase 1